MKKLTAFAIVLMLVFASCVTAFAKETKFESAGDLYQAWYDDMPDYICGVWSTYGGSRSLTFAIQDTEEGNLGKQKMLELIEDDSTVSFVYQKHSRNYLLQVQDELYPYFMKELGLVSTGLNERENRIDLGILKEKKDDAATIEMINELTAKYGDAIAVEYTNQPHALVTDDLSTVTEQPFYLLAICVMVVLVLASAFAVVKKKSMVLKTTAGKTVAVSAPLTTREVEDMVRKSDVLIPPDLDTKIMSAIEKTDK